MSRDYKRASNSGSGFSGTVGLFIGLALGLSIALGVYLHGRTPKIEPQLKPVPDKQATPRSAREGGAEGTEETGAKKYDFYDMLPKFEVVVPEREKAEGADPRAAQIEKPGAYVLQAGSYRNFADADRMRARLALQGIESKIQKVAVDSDTWHRIRIGPIANLEELNKTRALLRQANIEALVIRVGE